MKKGNALSLVLFVLLVFVLFIVPNKKAQIGDTQREVLDNKNSVDETQENTTKSSFLDQLTQEYHEEAKDKKMNEDNAFEVSYLITIIAGMSLWAFLGIEGLLIGLKRIKKKVNYSHFYLALALFGLSLFSVMLFPDNAGILLVVTGVIFMIGVFFWLCAFVISLFLKKEPEEIKEEKTASRIGISKIIAGLTMIVLLAMCVYPPFHSPTVKSSIWIDEGYACFFSPPKKYSKVDYEKLLHQGFMVALTGGILYLICMKQEGKPR